MAPIPCCVILFCDGDASVENGALNLRLSRPEKLGALHGDVRVACDAVEDLYVSRRPFGELRGVRAPGTGVPGRIALGTWRYRGDKDFAISRVEHWRGVLDDDNFRPGPPFAGVSTGGASGPARCGDSAAATSKVGAAQAGKRRLSPRSQRPFACDETRALRGRRPLPLPTTGATASASMQHSDPAVRGGR